MFYDSVISAAEKDARKSGYSMLILQSGDDPIQEEENLKLCKHYRVDGILISASADSYSTELLTKYQESGIPIVFFDKVPVSEKFDTVCMADEEAATMAANTIIKYNKKKVLALFGNPDLSISKKRKEAFLKILEKEKDIKVEFQHCENTDQAKAFTTLAINKSAIPDHIFCMSDEILIGTMKALKNSSLKIPDDISILAISNGFIPGLYNPEISYIETSGHELGKLAIQRMLENMDEKTPVKSIILPSRLVEGGSL
jgi:LacI family transcriptional regulator